MIVDRKPLFSAASSAEYQAMLDRKGLADDIARAYSSLRMIKYGYVLPFDDLKLKEQYG